MQKVAESMLSFVAFFLSFTAVAELSETVFFPLQIWLTRLCFISCTDVAELSETKPRLWKTENVLHQTWLWSET